MFDCVYPIDMVARQPKYSRDISLLTCILGVLVWELSEHSLYLASE